MAKSVPEPIELDFADESLALQMTRWLAHLRSERRLSPKTLEAYGRDLRQCLQFLCEHWGARVTLSRFAGLEAADIRAFMAMRRAGEIGGRSLMRSLAVEWGPRGIRTVAIAPGAIRTEGAFSRLLPTPELEKKLLDHNPLHRFGTLEEIGNLAAFLVSDYAGYINGEMVYMDGGEMLASSSSFSMIGRRLPDSAWQIMKPKKG